jgi:hypothetical protein
MAYKKRQHFVPQTYLKSWTTVNELYTLPKKNGIARKQPTKTIAKQNNLYTVPSIFFQNSESRNPELQELISENLIFKIWEDRWPKVLECINANKFSNDSIRDLKGFIIAQSFRTPKFLRLNKEKIERIGKSSIDIDDVYQYAILGMEGLTKYIQNCVCEVIKCNDISNFITSDNPATHWFQEGEIFYHLNGIALNDSLFKNINYKILCPLHPKYFGILTPNLGIEVSDIIKNNILYRIVYNDNVRELNKMVEHGADKMLFAKNLNDFI